MNPKNENPCAEQKLIPTKRIVRKCSDASMDYTLPAAEVKRLVDAGELWFIPDVMGYMFRTDPERKRTVK
jgi:hypothetical protein